MFSSQYIWRAGIEILNFQLIMWCVTIVKIFICVVSDKLEGKPVSVEHEYFLPRMIGTTCVFTVFRPKDFISSHSILKTNQS